MLHEIRFHNFHGHHRLRFRLPVAGGKLSGAQARRWENEICPSGPSDCKCGGGYGEGFEAGSAIIRRISQAEGGFELILPAQAREECEILWKMEK